jgi:hypothetical protein
VRVEHEVTERAKVICQGLACGKSLRELCENLQAEDAYWLEKAEAEVRRFLEISWLLPDTVVTKHDDMRPSVKARLSYVLHGDSS